MECAAKMIETETQNPASVKCAQGLSFWFVPCIFYVFGGCYVYILLTSLPTTVVNLVCYFLVILLCVGFAIVFTTMALSYVQADQSGLTWYFWGKKKGATWDDVTAYYLLPRHKSTLLHFVVTANGNFQFAKGWSNDFNFRNFVQQHANHVPMTTWEVLGTDPKFARPVVFKYPGPLVRYTTPVLSSFIILKYVWHVSLDFKRHGVSYAMVHDGLPLFICLVMYWAILALTLFGPLTARRHQSITTTADGVEFSNRAEQYNIGWNQIISLTRKRSGTRMSYLYTMEAAADSITFDSSITNRTHLMQVVEHKSNLTWPVENSQKPKTIAVRIGSSASENGIAQVYGYRSKNLTFALVQLTIVALAFTLLSEYISWRHSTGAFVPNIPAYLLFLAGVSWLVWRYRAGGIMVDETGLTEFSAFGRHWLKWTDIELYEEAGPLYVVKGKGVALRFWPTINSKELLKEEIKQRAVNSSTKEWQSKSR
jgi:hypothetical protein